MVVVDEVDRTERAVLLYLSYHTAYAVAVVRVVFFVESHSVVAYCKKFTVLGNKEAHSLVHNGNKVVRLALVGLFGVAFGHFVFGKYYCRISPVVAVGRCHQQRM